MAADRSTPSTGVAVLGLGLMGGTLASHLLAEGHDVIGYDPDAQRREEHAARGGRVADGVGPAVAGCGLILLSLPNSAIMLDVCAEMALASKTPTADDPTADDPTADDPTADNPTADNPSSDRPLVIDTTTGDPQDSIRAAAIMADAGGSYVDATVSGNAAQAVDKDIIFMVGGNDADVGRATELLDPLCRHVYHVGGVASGSRAKLVVNHILSINRAAVAEGLAVAEKAGVELEAMLQILKDSAAYSKAMDIWGERMVAGDHEPPASRVRQSLKDSRLINDHAQSIGASRELVDVVRLALIEAVEGGLADFDNSSAMEVMRRRADLGRIPTD